MKQKSINVFGVMLTSIQEMMFYRYLSEKGIAMNTIPSQERMKVVTDWMKNNGHQ